MSSPYNPLDKMNLGRSVAEALLLSPVMPLANVADLAGARAYMRFITQERSNPARRSQRRTNLAFLSSQSMSEKRFRRVRGRAV